MPVSSVDVVAPAFERMKRMLFQPIRIGQWLRFALVGFLAGEMGGGFTSGWRSGLSSSGENSPFPFPFPSGRATFIVLAIVLAALLITVLAIVFVYISSRMRFVLFDSIVEGECRIRDFWSRRGGPAFRYFLFQLLVGIAGLASFVFLIGIPLLIAYSIGVFQSPRDHILGIVLGGLIVLLILIALLVFFILLQILTKDFVVPQMALEDVSVSTAWQRLWSMMGAEKGGYAGYIALKAVLRLAAAIVLGIITFVVIIVLLIPVGGMGVITVLLGRAAGLSWNPLTIAIAIVVVAAAILALFLIASLISVPAIVFFPAYSVYFFAGRYPPLQAVLNPPAFSPPDLSSPSPQT